MSKRVYATLYADRWGRRGLLRQIARHPELFVVFTYLTSGPHRHLSGLFPYPEAMLSTLGINEEEADARLRRLEAMGAILVDWVSDVILVPMVLEDTVQTGLRGGDRRKVAIFKRIEELAPQWAGLMCNCMDSGVFACPINAPSMPLRRPIDAPSMPVDQGNRDQGTEEQGMQGEADASVPAEPTLSLVAAPEKTTRPSPAEQAFDLWNELGNQRVAYRYQGRVSKLGEKMGRFVKKYGADTVSAVIRHWWTSPDTEWRRNNNTLKNFLVYETFEGFVGAATQQQPSRRETMVIRVLHRAQRKERSFTIPADTPRSEYLKAAGINDVDQCEVVG